MKSYAKDIVIVVLSIVTAFISVSYFFGFLKKEKQTETEDIFCLVPDGYKSVLSVNKPEQFRRLILDKKNGNILFGKYIPDVFLSLIKQHDFRYVLFSFHKEGTVCYIKAGSNDKEKIRKTIKEKIFPYHSPQEENIYGIDFSYYPHKGSLFMGSFHHDGLWVASYSKRLLCEVARKQIYADIREQGNTLSETYRKFDHKATANTLVPAEDWDLRLAKGDSIIWELNSSSINMDLFPSEGNLCSFCSFPYSSSATDSIYYSVGDSIAERLRGNFPELNLSPQTTLDNKHIYITLCTPL